MNWRYHPEKRDGGRFGHAYYMDGAFKNYHFNNIAWGKSNEPYSKYANTSAFQEIISYQNTFFNNTVYKFLKGSRRQAPAAGRDKFLSNVWQDISYWVLWHNKPSKEEADPNAEDAGKQEDDFAYETNAYSRNIFHDISDKFGVFEQNGLPHDNLHSFQKAMEGEKALAADVGEISSTPLLRDGENHDFRLRHGTPPPAETSLFFNDNTLGMEDVF